MNRLFSSIAFGFIMLIFVMACNKDQVALPPQGNELSSRVVIAWNEEINHLIKVTPGYTLPVSARALAFAGMAIYESALPANPHFRSLEESIPDIKVKDRFHPSSRINPEIAINAALADICRHLFAGVSLTEMQQLQSFENAWHQTFSQNEDAATILRSQRWGRNVASALIEYEKSDEIGTQAYLNNVDPSFDAGSSPYHWIPTAPNFSPAIQPNWGSVGGIGVYVQNLEVNPPYPFSIAANSPMFTDAMELYTMSRNLDSEQMLMAEFWDDNIPEITLGPAARWTTILTNLIADQNMRLDVCVEAYIKTSLAVYNASILAWKAKYAYSRLRPETYIQHNIDPDFAPYMHAPSTPEYVSEHTLIAYAAATVIQQTLGLMPFTDRCHENQFAHRSYSSFMQAAGECAESRMYAGTHFRHSIKEAERLGKFCGDQVLKTIRWKF
jgi:hypothetical protein